MFKRFMTKFEGLALKVFLEPLERHGFALEATETDREFCRLTFVNGERYVRIAASIHPLDLPHEFSVVLGEGSREFLEADWNSIALWRVRNLIEGGDTGSNYSLQKRGRVPELLDQAKDELLEFGMDFLGGDLTDFRQARSDQNRQRQPYQVYSPDENGVYAAADEPESAKMKAKYS